MKKDMELVSSITRVALQENRDKTETEIQNIIDSEYGFLTELTFHTPYSYENKDNREKILREVDSAINRSEAIYRNLKKVPPDNIKTTNIKDDYNLIKTYIAEVKKLKQAIKKDTNVSYDKRVLYIFINNMKIVIKAAVMLGVLNTASSMYLAYTGNVIIFQVMIYSIFFAIMAYIFYYRKSAKLINSIILTTQHRSLSYKELEKYRGKLTMLNRKFETALKAAPKKNKQ